MELVIQEIKKNFGEKTVLKGITFRAVGGKAFGLLGRNGAGKTTTIRILMNVFPADGGEILLDGQPINYEKVKIGYLPEERGLYPKKKIIDQLIYFAQLKGLSKKEAVRAVDYWLEHLGMAEYRNKRLDTLSKGNQQKIQLITAVAHDPDIVILDEPFSGLDPVNAILLKNVVKEEIAKGKIVLFSSHQMNYIEEFCDHIAILNNGEIVLQGNLNEIKRSHARDSLVVRSDKNAVIKKDFADCCVENDREELIIRLKSPEEKQPVMRQLIEKYDVDEIRVYEPSLSDIFVEYAGK